MGEDHPFLEKQMGHKSSRTCATVRENCNLVSIGCDSV